MADVHSKETRSFNMSRIKGKNTLPEILVRKFLFARGFRYKIHDKALPGRPDLVFPMYSMVVFIHGCYWHGHEGCKYFVVPKTRTNWWINKINANKLRYKQNVTALKNHGWKVLTVWECELKDDKKIKTLENLARNIKGNK
ncbi:MAG: very short patch repair endonuclease [Bacteroidota bacterium]